MLNGSYGVIANATEDIIKGNQDHQAMRPFSISDYTLSKLFGDLVSGRIIRMARADLDENVLEYVFRVYTFFHKLGYMNICKGRTERRAVGPFFENVSRQKHTLNEIRKDST